MKASNVSRRNFIKASAIVGGGIALSFNLPGMQGVAEAANQDEDGQRVNGWIRIHPDNSVVILAASSEMGQGVYTSLPMILAEELDADWSLVRSEDAPSGDKTFVHPLFGMRGTGGSYSVRMWWPVLSKVGAAAREMFIIAAAKEWGVSAHDCRTEKSMVIHQPSGKELSYGSLAEAAAKIPVPQNPKLKDPSKYTLIGKATKRIDIPAKVDGSGVFGIDVKVPGMKHATVKTSPSFGGKLTGMDKKAALSSNGVSDVVMIPDGVAVVADSYWHAKKGMDALNPQFGESKIAKLDSKGISQTYREALEKEEGIPVQNLGTADQQIKEASKVLEATYEVPFQAHATMEPMNCTAHVTKDSCEIWAPTQGQTPAIFAASKVTGLPPEKIKVHTTFLGGGFGRRFEWDFIIQATVISKAIGKPVKMVWSREEDMQHDFYRPASMSEFKVAIDQNGMPVAWKNKIVSPSIAMRVFPAFYKNGVDGLAIEGAKELPYAIPHHKMTYIQRESGVPVGSWRSVGGSHNAFYVESIIDELAHMSGQDPCGYRSKLLASNPRFKNVLELAGKKANWGNSPKGRFQGIALHRSFGTIVAQVAEISVNSRKEVKVHRIVCVVDCGRYVNPETIEAQIQGAAIYGLAATMLGEITIQNGAVKQSNFHDFEMVKLHHTPPIEVHLVESKEAPGGIGEPGTPPIAPAITNAIFAATGKRIRSLPTLNHGFTLI